MSELRERKGRKPGLVLLGVGNELVSSGGVVGMLTESHVAINTVVLLGQLPSALSVLRVLLSRWWRRSRS
ncbi:hypothetical protein BCR35DRAFT_301739 [Leucosporidium creatinivorum]|uniref:Uncharacterized protein n=1 Tax=Leucosporidium creatinivorum TaxID=106004 RepID=A0A1Y2FW17_9BASI|nr:hypothetical protein BCR35DRAFT_301739 [Leucosporidium creatinivorum]